MWWNCRKAEGSTASIEPRDIDSSNALDFSIAVTIEGLLSISLTSHRHDFHQRHCWRRFVQRAASTVPRNAQSFSAKPPEPQKHPSKPILRHQNPWSKRICPGKVGLKEESGKEVAEYSTFPFTIQPLVHTLPR